jgi:hypothetical protein
MTATAVLPRLVRPYLGLELISEELQTRLVNRIAKDHALTLDEATYILDATLGYLKLCADYPETDFAPSRLVDIGWHTFLLYTLEYREFCERVAGYFIDHEPSDRLDSRLSPIMRGRGSAVSFMRNSGIVFDPAMWEVRDQIDECRRPPADCRPHKRSAGN